jgi:hypothetical protein
MNYLTTAKNLLTAGSLTPLISNIRPSGTPASGLQDRISSFIDPLSVVITFAINAYKPVGTKMSIKDSAITLHDASILQGFVRSWHGDTKTDIKALHYPVLYACKYYYSMLEHPEVRYIFITALRGIDNMRQTYSHDGDTRSALCSFYNVIQKCLDDNPVHVSTIIHMDKEPNPQQPLSSVASPQHQQGKGKHSHQQQTSHHPPHTQQQQQQQQNTPKNSTGASSSSPMIEQREKEKGAMHMIETLLRLTISGDIGINEIDLTDEVISIKSNIYEKLNKNWDERKIVIVSSLLRELNHTMTATQEHLFSAIESFMNFMAYQNAMVLANIFTRK